MKLWHVLVGIIVGGVATVWLSAYTPDNAHFFPWILWFSLAGALLVASALCALWIDFRDN